MAEGGIPAEVQRFIAENIEAAEQLDILLLLYRNPERAYTALEVSQAVFNISPFAQLAISGTVIIIAVAVNARAEKRKGRVILKKAEAV